MSHYFVSDSSLKSNKQSISYTFDAHTFHFDTDSGVFSKGEIDYGSIALLKVLVNQDLGKRILDLGCGYGTIGIILKKHFEDADIDMVDINDKAVSLSKANCVRNHTINNVYESNGFENIKDQFDSIVTNPPIRAGKQVIYKMLEDSCQHLSCNGAIYLVMRKSHGAMSAVNKLQDLYGNCEIINRDKGFYILKSIKK